LVNFGNIQPSASGVARWLMTCSVSGSFVAFTATFTHSNDLGGRLTSLISSVNTHLLIHDILVDLPGRDNIRDFLAQDPDALRVYESQNNDSTVTDLSNSAAITGGGYSYTIAAPPAVGFSYAKLSDPLGGAKVIASVVRSDGKPINPNNAWLSSAQSNTTHLWSYFISIFDTNNTSGLSYNVTYADPVATKQPPLMQQPPDVIVQTGSFVGFIVKATQANGDPLVLTSSMLPSGATFTDNGDGTGTFSWTPSSGQTGEFPIQFTVADGSLTDQKSMTISVTSGSLYQDWRNHYFPGVSDQSIIGDNANPANDGLTNLVKYALGLDPTVPSLNGAPVIGTVQFGGQTFLTMAYVARTNDSFLSCSVVGANSSIAPDADWQTITDTEPADQSGVPANFQRFIFRDNVPIDGNTQKRFLRMKVSTSEPGQ
jgi:hypothetical protein